MFMFSISIYSWCRPKPLDDSARSISKKQALLFEEARIQPKLKRSLSKAKTAIENENRPVRVLESRGSNRHNMDKTLVLPGAIAETDET